MVRGGWGSSVAVWPTVQVHYNSGQGARNAVVRLYRHTVRSWRLQSSGMRQESERSQERRRDQTAACSNARTCATLYWGTIHDIELWDLGITVIDQALDLGR
jgi:hypothetical protein